MFYTASILNCHRLFAFEKDLKAKIWTNSIYFSIKAINKLSEKDEEILKKLRR